MANESSGVVDALPGLVWTASPDGRADFVNQHWCKYTGLVFEQAVWRGWEAAVHPDDQPAVQRWWKSMAASGEPNALEARLRRSDGEYRWFQFQARPLRDASGHVIKWCGISTDIEDQRRAEEALRTFEGRHRAIVDGLPALVAFSTPAGEIELVNRQVLEYFDKTLEELKDWTNSDAVHPDDRPRVIAAWKHSMDTGEPYDFEHRIRRGDGVYRWFQLRGFPLRDAEGRIVLWYSLQTDIDDQKKAEAALAAERRFLEMVARGDSMAAILNALCHLVETTVKGCYCTVVLLDSTGTRLENGAAPNLSASFIASMIGQPVSGESNPCARAARLNEQVFAADLMAETRWAASEWVPMAVAHGLRACWSTPIRSTAGKVLGAFALYYGEPKTPTSFEQTLIEPFTHIASIAIERAQSDASLRHSEARNAAILNSALDSIVTIDHEGVITEFNPAAERMFGYRRKEVVGQPLADVIIPASLREQHRRGFARYLATGETRVLGRRLELSAVRADGTEFPVELAITPIPLDGPPSFTGYLRDITERKQSEEAIRRSEAFLSEAQRLAAMGSFSWRVTTDELVWSEQLYHIFEIDPDVRVTIELIATRIHPEDLSRFEEQIERSRRDGSDVQLEIRLQMPDRTVKYVHVVAHGRNNGGQLEYIGAVQDVTQRRLSEEALAKVRSELAYVARVTSLGVLTASIAHEVNQPLAGILANAGTCVRMLAGDPPDVDGARETARRTIRDANRASDVMTRLRALFSRTEFSLERLDLNEATREVIALSLSDLQRHRVILHAELADDLPGITGDRIQLQQVILNLVRNASEAMVDVHGRPRLLLIKTEREDVDRVRVMIRDSGIGLPSERPDSLFDAFYTTKSGGMGIGLFVSRSIVERHQGRLWAESNDGPGASFLMSIPVQTT